MKPAALVTAAAALLTILAPHGVAAAPNSKTPVTVDTARTVSYNITRMERGKDGAFHVVSVGHVRIRRPDAYYADDMTINGRDKSHVLMIIRGNAFYYYDVAHGTYTKSESDSMIKQFITAQNSPTGKVRRVIFHGKLALLTVSMRKLDDGSTIEWKEFCDPATFAPVVTIGTAINGKTRTVVSQSFTDNVKLNANLPDLAFTYVAPPGTTMTRQIGDPEAARFLPKPGTTAPDFALNDVNGSAIHLSDYGGKVVLLDFWATWCVPCQRGLPHTQEIARKYAAQNVVVLGINVWDKPGAFTNWVSAHKNYDAITFVTDPAPRRQGITGLYGVRGIPSQIVIGRDGKVVAAYCGASAEDVAAAVNKALLPAPATP